jgi:hypothetical protein
MSDQKSSEYTCIVCHKDIKEEYPQETNNNFQPNYAVGFSGKGHYGSSFDLSRELYIVVCDECLADAIQSCRVHVKEEPKPTPPVFRRVIKNESVYDENRNW